MIAFDTLVRDAAEYLERNRRCLKHHVEHTGSNVYLLDFYTQLSEIEKGKSLVSYFLGKIVSDRQSQVFYPGRLNQMNMSNNVIDTGAAVDAITRFARTHRNSFTPAEHERIEVALKQVIETYLKQAAAEKPITNQRLWGLTGVASYARYTGEETLFRDVIIGSVERAFADMTSDGFFRYYPEASRHGAFKGYDGITTFYQSRCTAFIHYALAEAQIDSAPFEARLRKSEEALLSMHTAQGYKDLRLECKRWYWLSSYEVASHSFDAYALAYSAMPEAKIALHNALFLIRRHFFDGYLHSHKGAPVNFQCPIFWTAHLAWLTRIPDIKERFDSATELLPFSYRFLGTEVYTGTTPNQRILIDARWQERNPTVGIYLNGFPGRVYWGMRLPHLPPSLLFSLRETANHTWYALRGGYVREALLRLALCARELIVMLLPRYDIAYGKIHSLRVEKNSVEVEVSPASKYGTVLSDARERLSLKI